MRLARHIFLGAATFAFSAEVAGAVPRPNVRFVAADDPARRTVLASLAKRLGPLRRAPVNAKNRMRCA